MCPEMSSIDLLIISILKKRKLTVRALADQLAKKGLYHEDPYVRKKVRMLIAAGKIPEDRVLKGTRKGIRFRQVSSFSRARRRL